MAFARIIAKEYGRYGVRSNTVCPGPRHPRARRDRRGQPVAGRDRVRRDRSSPTWRRPRPLRTPSGGRRHRRRRRLAGFGPGPHADRTGPQRVRRLQHAPLTQATRRTTMRHERQVELLRRLHGVDAPRPGPLAPASMHNPADAYTSPERFADELRGAVPRPAGARRAVVRAARTRVLRDPHRRRRPAGRRPPARRVGARAFVNVCRHRGSTLLTAPCGDGLRSIRCPYHAWTYGLDGDLKAFPGAEPGFDDVDKRTHGLIEVPGRRGSTGSCSPSPTRRRPVRGRRRAARRRGRDRRLRHRRLRARRLAASTSGR